MTTNSTSQPNANLADEIKARVAVSEVVEQVVRLIRKGREFVGLCPFHNERSPSFTVNDDKGFAHCFGCGWHGSVIDFLMHAHNLSVAEAIQDLALLAGLATDSDTPRTPRRPIRPAPQQQAIVENSDRLRKINEAGRIWKSSQPIAGTPAATYLRARGIDVDRILPCLVMLRFHPALRHTPTRLDLPAMVGAFVRDLPDGRRVITGVHRTYLRADGADKAPVSQNKMMMGDCWGSAIRLGPAGEALGLAEGIETGLSVLQACLGGVRLRGRDYPGLAIWIAGSIGNMAGSGRGQGPRHPDFPNDHRRRLPSTLPDMDRPGIIVPQGVKLLVQLADNDSKDPKAGRRLMERGERRAIAQGREVITAWPPAGADFNDVVRGLATEQVAV